MRMRRPVEHGHHHHHHGHAHGPGTTSSSSSSRGRTHEDRRRLPVDRDLDPAAAAMASASSLLRGLRVSEGVSSTSTSSITERGDSCTGGLRRLPAAFVCPLSGKVLVDPVLLGPSGHSYDREELLRYLRSDAAACCASPVPPAAAAAAAAAFPAAASTTARSPSRGASVRSGGGAAAAGGRCPSPFNSLAREPVTGQPMKLALVLSSGLFPNHALRSAVREYFASAAERLLSAPASAPRALTLRLLLGCGGGSGRPPLAVTVPTDATVHEAAVVLLGLNPHEALPRGPLFHKGTGRQVDLARPLAEQGVASLLPLSAAGEEEEEENEGQPPALELVTRYDLLPASARQSFSVRVRVSTGASAEIRRRQQHRGPPGPYYHHDDEDEEEEDEQEVTLHGVWAGTSAAEVVARALEAAAGLPVAAAGAAAAAGGFMSPTPSLSGVRGRRPVLVPVTDDFPSPSPLSPMVALPALPTLAPLGDHGVGPGSLLRLMWAPVSRRPLLPAFPFAPPHGPPVSPTTEGEEEEEEEEEEIAGAVSESFPYEDEETSSSPSPSSLPRAALRQRQQQRQLFLAGLPKPVADLAWLLVARANAHLQRAARARAGALTTPQSPAAAAAAAGAGAAAAAVGAVGASSSSSSSLGRPVLLQPPAPAAVGGREEEDDDDDDDAPA